MNSPVRKLEETQETTTIDEAIFKAKSRADDLKKKKMIVMIGAGVALVIISTMSYIWFVYSSSHISTDNAYIEADLYPLNSHIMGYVKNVLVEENDVVKKGQPIIELDDSDLQIELEYKEAKYKKAAIDLGRLKSLHHDSVISNSDLETAEAVATSMRADRDGTLLKMKFTKVVAPVDGVVSKQGVHSGQFVQPGQTLMTIVSQEKIWLRANFKETQVNKVARGMAVEATVDSYPHIVFNGKVESIYPSSGAAMSLIPPENATGNFTKIVQRFPVKISLERKPGYELRPGMSVVPTILVK